MKTYTLITLVDRAKEAIDAENQGNISLTTWKAWISMLYGRLHALVASTGYRYYETVQTVVTDGLTTNYALPADHFMAGTVVRVVTEQDRRRLRRAAAQETAYMPQGTGAPLGSEATCWAMVGQNLYLGPVRPPAGQVYEHRYVPQPADLTASADNTPVDVVTPDGEAFIIYGAAVKGLLKQDKDPRFQRDEYQEAYQNVLTWAQQRAQYEGHTLGQPREGMVERDPADWIDRHGEF